MADSPVATPHLREEAPGPTRSPSALEAAAPEAAAEQAAQALVRAMLPGAGGGSAGGASPPSAPTWTPRSTRVAPRDLVALQRMAGNRAVAGLMGRRPAAPIQQAAVAPEVQRQPAATQLRPVVQRKPKATVVEASLDDIQINPPEPPKPYALEYEADSLDEAAKSLSKDIKHEGDVIIIGLQQKLLIVYGKDGGRISQPFDLKLPDGVKPAPGVYMSPSAKDADENKRAFPMRQVNVDPTTQDWKLGGAISFLKEQEKQKAAAGDTGGDTKSAPEDQGSTGKGPDAATTPGAGDPTKGRKPLPFLNLRHYVKNGVLLDAIVISHREAIQFYLVPKPKPGSGGKPGAGSTTGFAGEVAGHGDPPNAPPWPVTMDGPRLQPSGSDGAFSTRINWAANGNDAGSDQVIAAVGNYIHYRWEVFDVTEYAKRNQAKIAAQSAATLAAIAKADEKGVALDTPASLAGLKPGDKAPAAGGGSASATPAAPAAPAPSANADTANAAAATTPPVAVGPDGEEQSYEDVIAERARSMPGSGTDPSAEARNTRFKRTFKELGDDTSRAAADIAHPSGSTMLERQSNAQANLIAIELTPITFVLSGLGASLRWVADLFSGPTDNQEIPFPHEGTFLVRVITTPGVTTKKDGTEVRRPSSVATRAVEVVRMDRMLKEGLDDQAAQLAQAELDLANAEKTKDAQRIATAKAAFELKKLETGGNPIDFLIAKIAAKKEELKGVKKRYEGVAVGPILEVERDIDVLENRLKVFRLQEERRGGSETTFPSQRVTAALVSEVTGQTYPLMLSIGPMKPEGNRQRWKLMDATGENAEGFDGYGTTASLAIKDAFRQFGGQAQYGRGKIAVRIPPEYVLWDAKDREFRVDSKPIGWAIARGRIDDLVMTLAALGLFVASAGTASIAIGAAVAAARLLSRLYNGTLRPDPGAVSDVLAILGAVGAAAGSAAKVGVAAAGVKFEKVGGKLVMLEEGMSVSSAELGEAAKVLEAAEALKTATAILEGIEKANEILNYGGLIWGNVSFFNDMLEVAEAEAKGPENGGITHAEARRRRASGLAGAINNNAMFIAPHVIKGVKARRAARAEAAGASHTGGGAEPLGHAEPTPKPETGAPQPGPEVTVVPEPAAPKEPGASKEAGGARDEHAGKSGTTESPGAPTTGGAGTKPAAKPTEKVAGAHEPGGKPGEPAAKPAETAAPKPGSVQERAAVHKALQDAARGNGDLRAAAENAIGKGGSWKEGLKGALKGLDGDHRVAAEKELVEARERIVNEEWENLQKKYPDLKFENAGTKAFGSDIDATIRPNDEAKVPGPEMKQQIEQSAQAAKDLSDALRKRIGGGETDIVIDTNVYSFIGEGRIVPTERAGQNAKGHVDMVVGLAEQMRGQSEATFNKFQEQLLKNAGDPRVVDEARKVLGQAKEFHDARQREWNDALKAAGAPNEAKATPEQKRIARDEILNRKKNELGGLVGGGPPNMDAVARKQSEINWFAPDAYATPSAFQQAVAHAQRLKGVAKPAAEWKGAEVSSKLREAAAKLPPEHPQAKQYELEAGRVESQQRLLEMTVKELSEVQDNAPVDGERVKTLESRAKGLSDAIAHSAEKLVIAQILGDTMPAGTPSSDRLSQASAASGANMGMLEAHVEHAKTIDEKVKAAAKYGGRIAMAEFLGGLRPSAGPIARLIGDFIQSRWGFLENASPRVMRDMFVRYARLTGRHGELVYNDRGEAIGATDTLKDAYVHDVRDWARASNAEIQQQAMGMKAFDNPTPSTPSLAGESEPAPKAGGGGAEEAPKAGSEHGAGEHGPGAPAMSPASTGAGEQPGRTPGTDEAPAGPAEKPVPREPMQITKAGGVTKPADTPLINPPGLNQVFDFRIEKLRDAEAAIRQIANGDVTPLSNRGVELPASYKTQGREWGLAQMPDGSFAIVQGDVGGVRWGDMPKGTIPLAHTHPLTPERALSKSATVGELIRNYEGGAPARLEQDAVNVFQSPEDILLVAANKIANHDVHTGYVHTGDGVLKTPSGAPGELQVSFNIYDAQHIGDMGSSPVIEAAFTAHDSAGNILYLGRVTVVNFEPNTANPRTLMTFKALSAVEKAKLNPPDPANLLPMHATPMAGQAGGGTPKDGPGGGTGPGPASGAGPEDGGPATKREGAGQAHQPSTAPVEKATPDKIKPARDPFSVERDEYSTTVRSRENGNAMARIEVEGGGVFKMTDVQKRDLPSGAGSDLLARALREVQAGPGNTLIIHGIINPETVTVYDAKGLPDASLLGKMSEKALMKIGLAPASMSWEIIRGKLCIVIKIQ